MGLSNEVRRDEEKMFVLDLVNSAAQAAKSGLMTLVQMLRRRFYMHSISITRDGKVEEEKACGWSYAPRGGLSLLVPVRWCPGIFRMRLCVTLLCTPPLNVI